MRSWIGMIACGLVVAAAGCAGGAWRAGRALAAEVAAYSPGRAAEAESGGGGGAGTDEQRSVSEPAARTATGADGHTLEGLAVGVRGPDLRAEAGEHGRGSSAEIGSGAPQGRAIETATDAVDTSGPLLVYTAVVHLAVYEVHESQARIVAAAQELGGFVFTQSDDRVVVRVPAPRFRAMLEAVEQAGDVEHRDVQAQDVSEEFHDLEIRIRNLEAVRARVEALLAQARSVEEALEVERQLARITQELELLRGRQRFLADRVALSTVTVLFRPRPREALDQPDVFELPFPWLDELGLANLLDLRS